MRKNILIAAAATTALLAASFQASAVKREHRATWMSAYVSDWPSTAITASNAENLKAVCNNNLDSLQRNNFTTIYYHARTMCDAMYDSKYEPWSSYVSGTRGVTPAFDPLGYIVEHAHERGLEVYAWLNPYRYLNSSYNTGWGENGGDKNYENSHPDWLIKWTTDSRTWTILNPALPEVKQRIVDVVLDIIDKYDVDGIVFDDYFYQESLPEEYDADDYAAYTSAGGTLSQLDWRRENVNDMVRKVYAAIKADKPWVRFGIGPAGVAGKNAAAYGLTPCPGSDWQYNGICSDPLAWLSEGTIDFISPQVYWKIGNTAADYAKITPWWYDVAAKFNRHCFISQTLSNIGSWEYSEIYNQIAMTHTECVGEAPGTVYFPWRYLGSTQRRVDGVTVSLLRYLRGNIFDTPSLTPATTWETVAYPGQVSNVARSGRTLTWDGPDNVRFTVYAVPSTIDAKHFYKDAQYLLGNTYTKSFTIPETLKKYEGYGIADADLDSYNYAVAVLDRYGNEYSTVFVGADVAASEKPVMTFPVGGEMAPKGFQFAWNGSAEVSEVKVATDAAMTNVVSRFEATGNVASSTGIYDFQPDTPYYWTVTARGNNSTDTEAGKVESFMVDIFRVLTPANGAENVTLTPTITWSDLGEGASYRLQVSTNESMTGAAVDETLSATSYTVPQYKLAAGATYYVKVTATVGDETEETEVFSFKTKAQEIAVPTIINPSADGQTLHSDEQVQVQPQEGVLSTKVMISDKNTFPARSSYTGTLGSGQFSTDNLADLKLVSKTLTDGTTYYVRAQFNYYNASGSQTATDWSDVKTFVYSAAAGVENVNADGISIVADVLSTGIASANVSVYAFDGKLQAAYVTDASGKVSLSALPEGSYLVKVAAKDGDKVVKFVKK